LVFYSSVITMMHGPVNIKLRENLKQFAVPKVTKKLNDIIPNGIRDNN